MKFFKDYFSKTLVVASAVAASKFDQQHSSNITKVVFVLIHPFQMLQKVR